MTTHFKIRRDLLNAIRADLQRPHHFAHERVGFIFAGLARPGPEGPLLLLAREYQPVEDGDYLDDPSVGAMMGPAAIRKALQAAYRTRAAVIHVHMHGHAGRPGFSSVDLRENARFIPNFFNVTPQLVHGAVVLSHDSVAGQVWLRAGARASSIDRFTSVGAPLGLNGAFT